MAQTVLDTASAGLYSLLITLSWGDSSVARYCRYDSDLTDGSNTFTACPRLKFQPQPQQGSSGDDPWDFWLEKSLAPMNTLARPYPHSPVSVLIQEMVPGNASTLRTLFKGRITRYSVNPDGKVLMVKCRASGPKSLFKLPLGFPATTTCGWIFGDDNCKYDVASVTKLGEITNLNQGGKSTRILTDLTDSPVGVLANERWRRGYVKYDGLSLMIRKSHQNGIFDLAQVPPPEWESTGSNTISFVPGCDKRLTTCRNVWQNESEFGGIGIAIPNRNPILEDPDNDDQEIV